MTERTHVKITIDRNTADDKSILAYRKNIEAVAECVIEMLEKNLATVLSPVLRQLLVDRAKTLLWQHQKIEAKGGIHLDNPGPPVFGLDQEPRR